MGNNVIQIVFFIIFIQTITSSTIPIPRWPTIKQKEIAKRELKDEQILYNKNIENETRLEIVSKDDKNLKNISHKYKKLPITRNIPFALLDEKIANTSCIGPSMDDFPEDLFTMEQKKKGAIILHVILAVYCFTLLAVVCNDYFLPSVERICEAMQLSEDVAAATFMAIATSAPEFFVNIVGTFVTESDIGVGTVMGSALFNTLGVAAIGGLAASTSIQLHWWPLTRDSIIYVVVISILVVMCHDGEIHWYEAVVLLVLYIIYFVIMWMNGHIKRKVKTVVKRVQSRNRVSMLSNEQTSTSTINSISANTSVITVNESMNRNDDDRINENPNQTQQINLNDEKKEEKHKMFSHLRIPDGCLGTKIFFIYSWPIRFLLTLTIPDCRKYPRVFPITFLMCVVWIGTNSYLVSWMITAIGTTIGVPDFVMGLTFLAAGGCLPEAISIFLVCRKGNGGMGVSNSLGANTLDILLCLGLPWFIKTMVSNRAPILLETGSLLYTIIALIVAVAVLYTTLALSRYRLSRKNGIILMLIYFVFLTTAILLEMKFIHETNVKPCIE